MTKQETMDKIKRAHMINDYTKGGLKMLDIQSFNNGIKAKWIQRYLDPNDKGKWKLFTDFFLGNHDATALFSGYKTRGCCHSRN